MENKIIKIRTWPNDWDQHVKTSLDLYLSDKNIILIDFLILSFSKILSLNFESQFIDTVCFTLEKNGNYYNIFVTQLKCGINNFFYSIFKLNNVNDDDFYALTKREQKYKSAWDLITEIIEIIINDKGNNDDDNGGEDDNDPIFPETPSGVIEPALS